MSALTIREMAAMERTAIQNGWTERRLLEYAGTRLGHAISRQFSRPGTAVGYLGKGHNAGDVLVALIILRDAYGWRVFTRHAFPHPERAPLAREMDAALAAEEFSPDAETPHRQPLLLIDGLIGTGTRGPLRAAIAALAGEMNHLRLTRGAMIAAADTPSGVHPDTGEAFPGSVTADATFMIGNAKRGLLTGHAANHTGRLAVVDVPCLQSTAATPVDLICPQHFPLVLPPRPFDFHKGMAGRVSLFAGSATYPGAAVLAAIGALRAGAGLITLHVPETARDSVISRLPPEIMLRTWSASADGDAVSRDSLVIGPGLGELDESSAAALLRLIRETETPAVIDADALTLIAKHRALDSLRPHHIITPHPGEFRRLFPESADMPREEAARAFVSRHGATLLLKGARTIVARHDHPVLWINSTGTPAMSTGGQGDLLSGVIGAFLASGMVAWEAACFSAWLCGRAAERTAAEQGNLCAPPSDVARFLGQAFIDWQTASR